MCRFTPLLKVHEAITLVTLSLIFPEKSENKPTVLSLNEDSDVDKVEYGDISSFKELENILFKEVIFKLKIKNCIILTLILTIFSHLMNGM